MKKILIILCLLLLVGCDKKEKQYKDEYQINHTINATFPYSDNEKFVIQEGDAFYVYYYREDEVYDFEIQIVLDEEDDLEEYKKYIRNEFESEGTKVNDITIKDGMVIIKFGINYVIENFGDNKVETIRNYYLSYENEEYD